MPKKNVKSCKNKLGKCGVIETPRQEAVIGGNLLELHFWCCDDGDDDDHHHDDHDAIMMRKIKVTIILQTLKWATTLVRVESVSTVEQSQLHSGAEMGQVTI